MKINQNKLARAGMMIAAMGMVATMGGCGGTFPPRNVADVDKSGRGNSIVYMSVASAGGILTSDHVCDKAPLAANDSRCLGRANYYGVAGFTYLSSFALGAPPITVLVPKSEKVGANDIIRIRLADGVPAYFEKVITVGGVGFGHNGKQHDTSSDCYNENRSGVAVVCPKFNWSYKDLEPRN